MKKYIIPIMMLLPLSTQAQTVLTEQQQLEQAQKQLEAAKKALEIAKIKAEAARIKAQTDSINKLAEKANEEAKQAQQESSSQLTPVTATEPKSPSEGWAIPTTVAKKPETKKAQTTANGVVLKEDPKYLAGALTYNAEGKIEFTLDTDANGKTAKQIYDIVYQYMSDLSQGKNNIASRMALVNPNEYVIANTMDEWLVFSSSFISLDRSEFKYQLVAKIADNHLHLTMARMNYNYEEGRATAIKDAAENVINDKIALTKKKNGLAKIFGKFRRLTIDRKDQIFNEITALVKQ